MFDKIFLSRKSNALERSKNIPNLCSPPSNAKYMSFLYQMLNICLFSIKCWIYVFFLSNVEYKYFLYQMLNISIFSIKCWIYVFSLSNAEYMSFLYQMLNMCLSQLSGRLVRLNILAWIQIENYWSSFAHPIDILFTSSQLFVLVYSRMERLKSVDN